MHSPLARVILTMLGGYLIILAILYAHDWISEEYPRRPNKSTGTDRILHPIDHEVAVKALELFSRLPQHEQTAIIRGLQSNLISLDHYLERLDGSNFQILCMGELHEESTRNFLAAEFFPNVRTDSLLLEATPRELRHLIKRMDAGRDYFPLLDADILNILRSAIAKNPDIRIQGIEETEEQQKNLGQSNSRDRNIARNFRDTFQPGKRHIILFGALHCTNESNWLFNHLFNGAPPILKERMLNVQVLGEHQNGLMEAFVYFLDEIGIEKRHFVIADTNSLPPRIYTYFQLLQRNLLSKYRALIVFRPSSPLAP